jgi:two-component system, cell cycle response regulator
MKEKLRILIIDDDEVDRKNVRRIMSDFETTLELIDAKNIKEGIEKSKEGNFDCLLLDYELPDGDAFIFLERYFGEEGHSAPVIFLTGVGDEELAVKALKNGAADYLSKNKLNYENLSRSILTAIEVRELSLRSKKAEQDLTQRENEYRTIIESVSDIIFKLDSEGNIAYINPAIKHLGYDPKQLLNQPIKSLVKSELKNEINLQEIATKRVGPRATTDYQAQFKVNEGSNLFQFIDSVSVLIEAKGLWDVPEDQVMDRSAKKTFLNSLCVARNITELKRVENELRQNHKKLMKANLKLKKISTQDSLTGIANRYSFDEYFSHEIRRAGRTKAALSLIMIDIDYFKNFNDTYGHQAGDKCLTEVATVLNKSLGRSGDLVARYGGEEFILALPGTDEKGAVAFAETLRARVEDLKIEHSDSAINKFVTISLGVFTCYPDPITTAEKIIEIADKALYKAKKQGRNQLANGNAMST